jgi:hypothetical protein
MATDEDELWRWIAKDVVRGEACPPCCGSGLDSWCVTLLLRVQASLGAVKQLLIPVHLTLHWAVLELDLTWFEARYYDSMRQSPPEHLQVRHVSAHGCCEALVGSADDAWQRALLRLGPLLGISRPFRLVNKRQAFAAAGVPFPTQTTSVDCGVFMLETIRRLVQGRPLDYSQVTTSRPIIVGGIAAVDAPVGFECAGGRCRAATTHGIEHSSERLSSVVTKPFLFSFRITTRTPTPPTKGVSRQVRSAILTFSCWCCCRQAWFCAQPGCLELIVGLWSRNVWSDKAFV